MKLSTKIILPIILISALLILLNGCWGVPADEEPGVTPPTYTVTYDGNGNTGGVVPVDANLYEEDASVTVLDNTGNLVKTGFEFDGWNTAPDGNGTDYMLEDILIMGTANVTLYAQWVRPPGYGPGPLPLPTPTPPDPCAGHDASPVVLAPDDLEAIAGQLYEGQVIATDADGDTLTFDWTAGFEPPGDMEITPDGLITWTPGCEDVCDCPDGEPKGKPNGEPNGDCNPIEVTVSDDCGGSADVVFCIEVVPNLPPSFKNEPEEPEVVVGGADYSFDASATDPDSSPLVYAEGDNFPYWLNLDTSTGEISGKAPCPPDCEEAKGGPPGCEPCYFDVDVEVEDECSTVKLSFEIEVKYNRKPYITSKPCYGIMCVPKVDIGESYEYKVVATDSDSADLTFALGKHPENMTITKTGAKTATVDWIGACPAKYTRSYECKVDVEVIVSDECSEKVQSYKIYVYK